MKALALLPVLGMLNVSPAAAHAQPASACMRPLLPDSELPPAGNQNPALTGKVKQQVKSDFAAWVDTNTAVTQRQLELDQAAIQMGDNLMKDPLWKTLAKADQTAFKKGMALAKAQWAKVQHLGFTPKTLACHERFDHRSEKQTASLNKALSILDEAAVSIPASIAKRFETVPNAEAFLNRIGESFQQRYKAYYIALNNNKVAASHFVDSAGVYHQVSTGEI